MANDGRWRIAPQDAGRLIAGAHLRLLVPQGWAIRRALEPLPAKSLPFIDAFVRHQIDRVTPWRAADCHVAVTTAATPQAADRVTVSILALPRRVIDPLVAPLLAGRPRSLRIIPGASTEEAGIDVPAGGDRRRLVTQRLAASLLVVVAALPVALWAVASWQAARLGSAAEALDAAIASRKQRLAAAAAL